MQELFGKIIEKLEEIRVNPTCNKEKCDTKELCRICVVDDAIEIVKQEAEQYNGGWIPCSERLPEESGKYEVTALDAGRLIVTQAKWQPKLKSWNLTGAMAYWKIIAWKPLPEPYRPKGE